MATLDIVRTAVTVAELIAEREDVGVIVFTFVAYEVSVLRATVGDADEVDNNDIPEKMLEIGVAELLKEEKGENVIADAVGV